MSRFVRGETFSTMVIGALDISAWYSVLRLNGEYSLSNVHSISETSFLVG
jgi:hypothetical protein